MSATRVAVSLAGIALAIGLWTVGGRAASAEQRAPMLSSAAGSQAASKQAAPSGFDSSKAWEHLRQMVSFGPRPAGSAALRLTRQYITRQLSSVGLTVQEQVFTAATPVGNVEMVNLAVRLPGRRPDRILLTGHYDTKPLRNQVFVGASDGASSAAILIELARVLKDKPHEFTYEVIWFDGEEAFCEGWDECHSTSASGKADAPDNTYGSRYYVQAAKAAGALSSIKAMILFDMIGAKSVKLKRDRSSTPWLVDIFWSAAKKLGHAGTFADESTAVGGDDHMAFVEARIPSIDLIDLDDYPQWHTKDDDLAHVSAGSLQIVGDVTLAALPDVERRLSR
jgi:hypothetical protein